MDTFGRSFPKFILTNTAGNWSLFRTSSRIRGGRVADMATIGVPFGSSARSIPRQLYALRKLAPQCDTTCASSTTTDNRWVANSHFFKTLVRNLFDSNISGEMMTICHQPLQTCCWWLYQAFSNWIITSTYVHYFTSASTSLAVDGCCSQFEVIRKGFHLYEKFVSFNNSGSW